MLEIIKIVLLGPVNDMKTTPGTSLSVIILWCVIAYAMFVTLPSLAKAGDMQVAQESARQVKESAEKLQASVASLDRRLRYDSLHRDSDQVDTELAAVDREIVRLSRLNQEPSDFLLDRQQRLSSRKNDIARQINAMIQQFPELMSQ